MVTEKNFYDKKQWCLETHDIEVNQKYDQYGYSYHLLMVEDFVLKFSKYYEFSDEELEILRLGAVGHDLLEDGRKTYHDVKNMLGVEVADIVYACSEEKGHNREERHSEKFWEELKDNWFAGYVKLCDIAANVCHSRHTQNTMYYKYKQEFPKVKAKLGYEEYKEIFDEIEEMLSLVIFK